MLAMKQGVRRWLRSWGAQKNEKLSRWRGAHHGPRLTGLAHRGGRGEWLEVRLGRAEGP